MTYRGTVKGGVIVLEGNVKLREGQLVEVRTPSEAQTPAENLPPWGEVLGDFIGKAEGLPPDAAKNHDHYLYGAPKR